MIANADGMTACDARIILRSGPTTTGDRGPVGDARDSGAALDRFLLRSLFLSA